MNNKISLFRTKEDLYLNFDTNKDNIILITGISGSGKSTLAEKMTSENDGQKISLDLAFFHEKEEKITAIERKIVDKFSEKYPEWTPNTFTQEESINYKYSNLFYDFVLNYLKNIKNKLIIIEGGQHISKYIDFDKIKDRKIIIKRTNLIKSATRRIKRTGIYTYKKFKSTSKIKQIYKCTYEILRDIKYTIIKGQAYNWLKINNTFIEKITTYINSNKQQ